MTPEIILDSFAGGGGASTGIELALGRSPDLAINHDREAIAMHTANHPATEHFCESVWDVDPVAATRGRPVGLAWFSPDCAHFSKAKGGKPREKRIRGLAWVVLRWVQAVLPRVICLENVEEFQGWGPLRADGHAHAHSRGWYFRCFVGALRRRGYAVEWRELRACDFGAPTIRKRLFLVARCDGRPIAWPAATHGAPDSDGVRAGRLAPWRTAAECIDWSLPRPSIFTRQRPLAEGTRRRIAKGIMRYVVNAAEPFIIPLTHPLGWAPIFTMEIPLIIKSTALDFELCELLGEKPGDFLVLCANGEQVPFFGTPWDSPLARKAQQAFVDSINDRSKESSWPEFFANWKTYFCREYKLPTETTAAGYHPNFSWVIERVCTGYSEHLHVAISLFEALGAKVKSWTLARAPGGPDMVEIVSASGAVYRETGSGMAALIAQSAARLLRDWPNRAIRG